MRTKTKTNPVFYAQELDRWLTDEPERRKKVFEDPQSVDLLTWNVFASLETHTDSDWLAHRLQTFGGSGVRAPVRMTLWSGREREPRLQPSRGYVEQLRAAAAARGDTDEQIASFLAPIEVAVRIESPDVLVLVDVAVEGYARGGGGRDRLLELIDAGLDQARRLSKELAVAIVYRSGTRAAGEISARAGALRDPRVLARELPWRERVPAVVLREVSWQQLMRIWEQEAPYLRLGGQPVRSFLDHAATRGLR